MTTYNNRQMIEHVRDVLKQLGEGLTVVVGLSGGPDSMCLLHILSQLQESCGLRLHAVHVNHKLRADSSDAEAEHVREFCRVLGVPCEVVEFDCREYAAEHGMSLEEAGRHARYEIFDRVAEKLAAASNNICIALAHNSDDQAETVLFRLIRGTGMHGAAGMKELRLSSQGHTIIRPLLRIPRADIERYIADNALEPNNDESNLETDFARNKIRLELIPYIEQNLNPNVKDAVVRFARLAGADDAYMNSQVANLLAAPENITVTEMRGLDTAIKSRLIKRIVDDAGLTEGITEEHIAAIQELIDNTNPSASIDLPQGYVAARDYDRLLVERRGGVRVGDAVRIAEERVGDVQDVPALNTQIIDIDTYRAITEQFGPSGRVKLYAAFDYDVIVAKYPNIVSELELRTRREHDFVAIRGGSKKLQNYFVDAKVSRLSRDSIRLVAIGSEILWLVDINKFSQNFHTNPTTQRVLYLEVN